MSQCAIIIRQLVAVKAAIISMISAPSSAPRRRSCLRPAASAAYMRRQFPSDFRRFAHGARHRRRLRRQGREPLRAGAARQPPGAHDLERRAADRRPRQRQEPGRGAARDRRPDDRARGPQGRPDPLAAEIRRGRRAGARGGADDRLAGTPAPTSRPRTARSPSTACRRRSCCAAWKAWFRRTRRRISKPHPSRALRAALVVNLPRHYIWYCSYGAGRGSAGAGNGRISAP